MMPAEVCAGPWAGALVPAGGVQHLLRLHEEFSVGLVLDVGRWVREWLIQQHCLDGQVPFPLVANVTSYHHTPVGRIGVHLLSQDTVTRSH